MKIEKQNEPQLSAEMEEKIYQEFIKLFDLPTMACEIDESQKRVVASLGVGIYRQAIATALTDERDRIKRCLMPVIDLECNHEEGSTPVEDNLGQYHVASGVCCKCGVSVLDWKQNKPQLSAEMEKLVDKELAWIGNISSNLASEYGSDGEASADQDMQRVKHFLATALEEQRLGYIEQVNKLMTVRVMDDRFLDTPFLYKSDVLAILTKKEQ